MSCPHYFNFQFSMEKKNNNGIVRILTLQHCITSPPLAAQPVGSTLNKFSCCPKADNIWHFYEPSLLQMVACTARFNDPIHDTWQWLLETSLQPQPFFAIINYYTESGNFSSTSSRALGATLPVISSLAYLNKWRPELKQKNHFKRYVRTREAMALLLVSLANGTQGSTIQIKKKKK